MGPICMYKSNLIIFRLLTGMTPTDKTHSEFTQHEDSADRELVKLQSYGVAGWVNYMYNVIIRLFSMVS